MLNIYRLIFLKLQVELFQFCVQILLQQSQLNRMEDQVKPKRESTFPLFSKYFITHPQDVVEYTQNMRKQMQDFIEAFRKRIDVETTYSKNLVQVSKCLDKYIKPGTQLSTSYICSAFKVEHQQRARQALELAESIKTQIDTICTDMLKSHTNTMKKMEKDIKRFYKQAEAYEDSHRSSIQSFQGINKQTEQLIITKHIYKFTSTLPPQKKQKMIWKTNENVKTNKQFQKSYLQSVRNFNHFAQNYNKQVRIQLDQAERLIREQVILQGDCLRKLIVAEVSMFKNIQYDLLNISKQMEYLDTQKDVEVFTEDKKNNTQNKIISELKEEESAKKITKDLQFQKNNLQLKKVIGKSLLSDSIFYVEEDYYSWVLSNKRNKRLRQVISMIWKHLRLGQNKLNSIQTSTEKQFTQKKQQGTIQIREAAIIQEKKQQISDASQTPNKDNTRAWDKELIEIIQSFKIVNPPDYMKAVNNIKSRSSQDIYQKFVQITSLIAQVWNNQEIDNDLLINKIQSLQMLISEHHLYRLIAYMFIQEFRVQHQVIIKSLGNAKICGAVVRAIINESVKKSDVFIIRQILGLIFTFYWIDGKSKKLLYQIPQIYQFQIWKKRDFWQAAIFQTAYQQMTIFTPQKGESQQQMIIRQKNIIFSQFASFCHYMVLLGNQSKDVRQIVGRFCRLYEMTEQHNKDLSRMIGNTSKQHKQTLQKSIEKTE